MRVQVLFFGVLREMVGRGQETVEVEAGTTAVELIAKFAAGTSKQNETWAQNEMWARLAVAVNREYVGRETVLADGDEVALLPPVSGGRR